MRKLLLAAMVVAVAILPLHSAFATKPDPNHKVTICHRTHSASNPYVIITVDEASVNGDTGDDHGQGDHQTHNEGGAVGSVADAQALKDAGDWWGDIIPPFYENGDDGYWPKLNWDATGQAVFENGCNPTPLPPEEGQPTLDSSVECDLDNSQYIITYTGDGGEGFTDSDPALPVTHTIAGNSVSDSLEVTFNYEEQDSITLTETVELDGDCVPPPPQGEASAALTQGDCDNAAFVTLFNDTAEDATFSVTDAAGSTDYTLAAGTQQDVEVVFGEVEVTSGEATLLSDTANPVVGCNTGPNPPPPAPPGLPETL